MKNWVKRLLGGLLIAIGIAEAVLMLVFGTPVFQYWATVGECLLLGSALIAWSLWRIER